MTDCFVDIVSPASPLSLRRPDNEWASGPPEEDTDDREVVPPYLEEVGGVDVEGDANVVGPVSVHEERAQLGRDGHDAAGAEEDLEAVAFLDPGDGGRGRAR